VREKRWLGATGKPLTNVISIGIGGSCECNHVQAACSAWLKWLYLDLGPEFVPVALMTDVEARTYANGRTLRFLANVDPVDVLRAIGAGSHESLNAENTLVVIVSKTFTTAGTNDICGIGLSNVTEMQ
jgi:glucose-6-phosphate isomerase